MGEFISSGQTKSLKIHPPVLPLTGYSLPSLAGYPLPSLAGYPLPSLAGYPLPSLTGIGTHDVDPQWDLQWDSRCGLGLTMGTCNGDP